MVDVFVILPERIRSALVVLLNAFDYASDGSVDRWQLAIELKELLSQGASLNDIRWLILRGFVEHAKETTIPGDATRSFRTLPSTCCRFLSSLGIVKVDTGFSVFGSMT